MKRQQKAVTEEIRQDGKVLISSADGISTRIIFNNIVGTGLGRDIHERYIRHIAMDELGFVPGEIEYWRDGEMVRTHFIPNV